MLPNYHRVTTNSIAPLTFLLHFLFPHYNSACSTKSANAVGIDDAAMRLKCITKHKVVIKIKLNKSRKQEENVHITKRWRGEKKINWLKPIKRLGNSYNNNGSSSSSSGSSIVCSTAHTKTSSSARKAAQ